jgi:hypothetical protein
VSSSGALFVNICLKMCQLQFQQEVLQESKQMGPDTLKRLKVAFEELKKLISVSILLISFPSASVINVLFHKDLQYKILFNLFPTSKNSIL